MSKLMVIVPDKISDLIAKGEITERYYNPGNLFGEVHLVMTNDDRPDPALVQKMVGDARLFLHNLPDSRREFLPSLGWRPWLLGRWVEKAVTLARKVRPSLIRCHGALLNAFAAATIRDKLGIPYVVSLHINFDEDVRRRPQGAVKRVVTWAQQDIERVGLVNADLVMPVYQSIVPYLQRFGITRYEVCYNSLNPTRLRRKTSYQLHEPVKIISVGRQFEAKNPDNLIRAVATLPNVRLTLVGDGTYHDHLKTTADGCGVAGRVEFIRSRSERRTMRQIGGIRHLRHAQRILGCAEGGARTVVDRPSGCDQSAEWRADPRTDRGHLPPGAEHAGRVSTGAGTVDRRRRLS